MVINHPRAVSFLPCAADEVMRIIVKSLSTSACGPILPDLNLQLRHDCAFSAASFFKIDEPMPDLVRGEVALFGYGGFVEQGRRSQWLRQTGPEEKEAGNHDGGDQHDHPAETAPRRFCRLAEFEERSSSVLAAKRIDKGMILRLLRRLGRD